MDVVALGDGGDGLARLAALTRFHLLVLSELEGPAHFPARGLGTGAALPSAGADELALELGQSPKHAEHQPPMGRGDITRLATAGCSTLQIASVTGHSLRQVQTILDAHYLQHEESMTVDAVCKRERHEVAWKLPN